MSKLVYSCEGFDWDEGNLDKNWFLHEVTNQECEQLFFNLPLIIAQDKKHSQSEQRYFALGRTDRDRWLFVAFAIRKKLIRVISARDMNSREARKYGERFERDTDI
jgi:uncharacterized DUF497 family protein